MDLDPQVAEALGPDYASHPMVKEAPDLGSFIKSSVDTKKMVGNSIALPPKEAPEDVQKQWFNDNRGKLAERGFIKVGPEKPEDYKVNWGDTVEMPPEMDQALRAFAHSRGWHNDDLQALAEFYSKTVVGSVQEIPKPDAEKRLTTIFGGTPEGYKEGTSLATDAIGALESELFPGLWDQIEKERIISADGKSWIRRSSDPLTIYLLSELGKKTAGETSNGEFKHPGGGDKGAEAIQAEIKQIRTDTNNPYYKILNDGTGTQEQKQQAQNYLDDLYKKLYGTKEIG